MKKFIIGLLCLMCLSFIGCSTGVDFREEREITSKKSGSDYCEYYIGQWKFEWCDTIIANCDFAEVGDKVVIRNGEFLVIKKGTK